MAAPMQPNNLLVLQQRIAQLETRIRQSGIPGLADTLGAFSEGSCTNDCTYTCTGGCTGGNCALAELPGEAVTNPAQAAVR